MTRYFYTLQCDDSINFSNHLSLQTTTILVTVFIHPPTLSPLTSIPLVSVDRNQTLLTNHFILAIVCRYLVFMLKFKTVTWSQAHLPLWVGGLLSPSPFGVFGDWGWEVTEPGPDSGFLVWGKGMHQGFLICFMQDLIFLPELFSPGMLVRCVVSSLGITERGKKSVKLSLNPKKVNKVLSAEALKPGMVCIWGQGRRAGSRPSLPCLVSWGVSKPPFTYSLTVTRVGLFLTAEGLRVPGYLMEIEDLNLITLAGRGERKSMLKICW